MSDTLFEQVVAGLRPQLHRYCARMTGSVIDGDDVVQETVLKAMGAGEKPAIRAQLEAWLFRIAHNAAVDFLRSRNRQYALQSEEEPDMIADPAPGLAEQRAAAAASLHTFMRLPPLQRSAVVMKDVLGYSLQEVCGMTGASVPAVKAALHRGRTRLRELANEPGDQPPPQLDAGARPLMPRWPTMLTLTSSASMTRMVSKSRALNKST